MGSIIMEPDDITVFGGGSPDRNFTTICVSVGRIHSKGFFLGTNSLHYSVPLVLMQLSLSNIFVLLTSAILRPLGQPIMVSQLLGGIILGPSFMGRNIGFTRMFFPMRGLVLLDAISSFGWMFYFFLIGVQMDPWTLKKVERKSFAIGILTVAIPLLLGISWSFLLVQYFTMDAVIATSLPTVAEVESVFAFPVIANYLTELKIINSEFGQMALTSSMISGIFSFLVVTITILANQQYSGRYKLYQTAFTGIVLALVIFCVLRPAVVWMITRTPQGEPLSEEQIYVVLVCVLLTGFVSQATGLNIFYGPLVLGMALPPGPPLGSALVEKLDLMISYMFMPLFFVKTGLVINIFAVKLRSYVIVQFIILICWVGKFMGAFLPSLFCKIMPLRDAISLGLVMNAQGIVELGIFKLMKKVEAIDNEAFVVMCTSMVIVTGVMTPIIKHLYDPSRRYVVYRQRTIMNSSLDSEFRVLVCIHDQESVPTLIKLLEACHPSRRNPIVVYLLHLIEIVGRQSPFLIPYRPSRQPGSKCRPSEHIVNAFKHYEQSNHGIVSVNPFTAVSPHRIMHDSVCAVALDRRTSLIVIPFHKRLNADGTLQSVNNGIRVMNKNVLNKAPCSVAILVDRCHLDGTRPMFHSWPSTSYRAAVLFLGGPDDREALALGARMAGAKNVKLTMVRLLENGNITNNDQGDRRLDNEVVGEFRLSAVGNYSVMYMEEMVMDASGTLAVIRSMQDKYDLLIVGRHHDNASVLTQGLADWNENQELGAIGEVLASSDFKGNTTILVVQQHNTVVEEETLVEYIEYPMARSRRMESEEAEHTPISIHRSV